MQEWSCLASHGARGLGPVQDAGKEALPTQAQRLPGLSTSSVAAAGAGAARCAGAAVQGSPRLVRGPVGVAGAETAAGVLGLGRAARRRARGARHRSAGSSRGTPGAPALHARLPQLLARAGSGCPRRASERHGADGSRDGPLARAGVRVLSGRPAAAGRRSGSTPGRHEPRPLATRGTRAFDRRRPPPATNGVPAATVRAGNVPATKLRAVVCALSVFDAATEDLLLGEFVAHYTELGATHFIFYNRTQSRRARTFFGALTTVVSVEYLPWTRHDARSLLAYDCALRMRGRADVLAAVDTDERLVPWRVLAQGAVSQESGGDDAADWRLSDVRGSLLRMSRKTFCGADGDVSQGAAMLLSRHRRLGDVQAAGVVVADLDALLAGTLARTTPNECSYTGIPMKSVPPVQ
ncbi:uncharacterized protein LOC119442742 isoform X2 [Dermacentor silvarum]|uniref:uncharacterized protein LOC119442742 isoform X2 n=1 Tax=Dermacentor silvarum TaxID=543639 RepID=UPI0021008AFF|nr:uncharacterized protein LOC119442742 isoform X2 [Dermacentor silvarum]